MQLNNICSHGLLGGAQSSSPPLCLYILCSFSAVCTVSLEGQKGEKCVNLSGNLRTESSLLFLDSDGCFPYQPHQISQLFNTHACTHPHSSSLCVKTHTHLQTTSHWLTFTSWRPVLIFIKAEWFTPQGRLSVLSREVSPPSVDRFTSPRHHTCSALSVSRCVSSGWPLCSQSSAGLMVETYSMQLEAGAYVNFILRWQRTWWVWEDCATTVS